MAAARGAEWIAVTAMLAVGAWLIVRRDSWGRDVIQLSFLPERARAPLIGALGVAWLLAAVILAVIGGS